MTDDAAVYTLRCACWQNGYRPIQIYSPGAQFRNGAPIPGAGKRPVTNDWLQLALKDPPDAVARPTVSSLALNTGIVTGAVSGLDIDVLIPVVIDLILGVIERTLGPTPLSRIGRPPKIMLCYRADEPFAKLSTADYRMPDGSKAHFEILGQGQQFVAFGIHPETLQPYRWCEGSPETVPLAELPSITAMQGRDLIGEATRILTAMGGVPIKPATPPRDPAPPRPLASTSQPGEEGFFRKVNEAALDNIAAWVTALHSGFRDRGNSGWRLSSKDLGRDLEEDIAVHPDGIQDWGTRDPLTAIDLVIRLDKAADARAAALWLCEKLGIAPEELGWRASAKKRLAAGNREDTSNPTPGDGADPEPEAGAGTGGGDEGGGEPPPWPLEPPDPPPLGAVELPADGVPIDYSEEWLTLEFSRRHHDDLRHLAIFGRWYLWTGVYWIAEHTLKVFDLARKIVRAASAEIHARDIDGKLKRLASAVASAKTVAAVERLARADRRHATRESDWDRNLETFVTATATIELKTGVIRASRREDMNTKIAAIHADRNCPIPLWTAFLETITDNDEELQKYLQRMVGYCMTGLTIEHVLFFLYGTGANGKGVFLGTIADIFGDYAAVAPIELFFETQGERHPTELAHLWGARLALAQETERNRRWAEAKLKALTGGDKITARFMRQDFFDFVPRFKLVIAGNHRPSLRGVDEAIKRRLHLVPFLVTIPRKQRDRHLREKLKAEWPGILWWAIQGAVEWYRIGLAPPSAVVDASEAYFNDEDRLGQWLDECCVADAQAMTRTTVLFASWKKWCEGAGERCGSMKAFSQNLEKRYDRGHDRDNRAIFLGLRVAYRRDEAPPQC